MQLYDDAELIYILNICCPHRFYTKTISPQSQGCQIEKYTFIYLKNIEKYRLKYVEK